MYQHVQLSIRLPLRAPFSCDLNVAHMVLQVLVAERGPLVFVFNWHPHDDYEGLKVAAPQPGMTPLRLYTYMDFVCHTAQAHGCCLFSIQLQAQGKAYSTTDTNTQTQQLRVRHSKRLSTWA